MAFSEVNCSKLKKGRSIPPSTVLRRKSGSSLSGAYLRTIAAPAFTNSPLPLENPALRGQSPLRGVARLKSGVTVAQALAEMRTLKSSGDQKAFNLNLLPVNDFVVGDVRPALLAMLVAVTLLLLIAAVNVANLTLVRAAARVKEISIRAALGAGRGRIIRQLLTESLLLVLMGGVVGTLGAMMGIDLLVKLAPAGIPHLEQVGIDARVLGWTALVSLLTGVACGLAPAWQSARLKLNDALKEGGRGATEGAGQQRWRSSLVVVELALAVMLLIGAGLLLKSLWRLQQVDSGVKEERVLTMFLTLGGQRYSQDQQLVDCYTRVLLGVQALPGVRAAALSNSLPPGSYEFSTVFQIEGRPSTPDQSPFLAYVIRTSPSYSSTLGIALRSGRQFAASDNADAPRVLLIIEGMLFLDYPQRQPTRYEHIERIKQYLGLRSFGADDQAMVADFVREQVRAGTPPDDLPQHTEEHLRAGLIVLPGVTVLDRLVTAATIKAEEELHEALIARLTPDSKGLILALLVIPEGEKITPFQQLLQAARRPSPDALARELDHLEQVRALIPESFDLNDLPQPLIERWARLTGGLPTRSLQRFRESKRLALLLCGRTVAQSR